MKGWRMVLGAVAVLAVMWGGVWMTGHQSDGASPPDYAAQAAETATVIALTDDSDNGRSVVVPLGATLTITLQSNPTTGYQWATVDPLPSCLAVVSEGAMVPKENPDNLVGAPGQWRMALKAERRGAGTVSIAYRRAWEKTTPAAKTFRVTVQVE